MPIIGNNFVVVQKTTNPSSSDDSTQGYQVGNQWINTTSDAIFELADNTAGSAVWQLLTDSGVGAVNSVFGRTGTVTAQNNDYTFAQIGATPTTLSGYGITDAGTVTAVSVSAGNGFSGTVATPTTTPAISLSTTASGVLKGSSGSLVAATDSDITAKLITGYISGAGTVAATDSIIGAIQKLNGNDGLRALDSDVVHNTGNETIAGTKTFSSPISGSITGSAGTVTTIPTLSGEVTNTGNTVTLNNASVTGKVLTGYVSGAGTVAATDSILQAIQKLNGNAIIGGSGTVNIGAVNNLAYYPAATDAVSPLSTANNGVLVTSGAGVPSISSTLPLAVQTNITQVGANAITLGMQAQLAARSVIGNTTAGSATPTAVPTNTFIQTVNVQRFTASGTYTPTTGMKFALVEVQGAGGGGAGCVATGASDSAAGGGGCSGAYGRDLLTAAQIGASRVVTIASGGSSNSGAAGNAAGATSVGTLVVANGGVGGNVSIAASTFVRGPGGGTVVTATGTNASAILLQGNPGGDGIGYGNNDAGIGGNGGQSFYNGYTPVGSLNSSGTTGGGFGSGGGGAGFGGGGASLTGSSGLPGLVIITEYIGV